MIVNPVRPDCAAEIDIIGVAFVALRSVPLSNVIPEAAGSMNRVIRRIIGQWILQIDIAIRGIDIRPVFIGPVRMQKLVEFQVRQRLGLLVPDGISLQKYIPVTVHITDGTTVLIRDKEGVPFIVEG